MSESLIAASAERLQSTWMWTVNLSQAVLGSFSKAGLWAANTAQEFGSGLSALLGPVVISVYAFAAWSLTANLGYTDSFVFASGPLSNWIVWLALAIAANSASAVLKRHTQRDRSSQ